MFGLVDALILFGGSAVVIRAAEARGRNPYFWGVASILIAGAATWGAWGYLMGRVHAGEDAGLEGVSVLFAPLATHIAVAVIVLKLPAPAGRTRAKSWPMTRMDADHAACVLRLADDGIAVESESQAVEVAYRVLTSVRPDGECLRVHWLDDDGEHSMLLMPVRGPRTREGRERLLDAIAQRVQTRMTR